MHRYKIIRITKDSRYRQLCCICDEPLLEVYYNLDINKIEGGFDSSKFKSICHDCREKIRLG